MDSPQTDRYTRYLQGKKNISSCFSGMLDGLNDSQLTNLEQLSDDQVLAWLQYIACVDSEKFDEFISRLPDDFNTANTGIEQGRKGRLALVFGPTFSHWKELFQGRRKELKDQFSKILGHLDSEKMKFLDHFSPEQQTTLLEYLANVDPQSFDSIMSQLPDNFDLMTPDQRLEYWDDSFASIKRSIRLECQEKSCSQKVDKSGEILHKNRVYMYSIFSRCWKLREITVTIQGKGSDIKTKAECNTYCPASYITQFNGEEETFHAGAHKPMLFYRGIIPTEDHQQIAGLEQLKLVTDIVSQVILN